jgi:hypothetical protein
MAATPTMPMSCRKTDRPAGDGFPHAENGESSQTQWAAVRNVPQPTSVPLQICE